MKESPEGPLKSLLVFVLVFSSVYYASSLDTCYRHITIKIETI